MSDNVYAQINDRSKLIFKKLVESYLKTGSPAGSETIMKMGGLNLSSASIRSILSNLQKEGLLYAPHRSAGRMPTEKGMRFFVDGLLEFGRISKLDKENIKCDNNALANLIMKFAPDWRRILNELQRYSVNGAIDIGITNALDDKNYDDLFKFLKSKDFKKMRNWVVNNIDTDASAIFRAVYDRMQDKVTPQSIPQLVLILADYQYKNAFVADHELNVVACLTEVMSDVQFN